MARELNFKLGNIRIRNRLGLLLGVQLVVIVALGAIALTTLDFSQATNRELNAKVSQATRLITLSESLRTEMVDNVHAVNAGTITWPQSRSRLQRAGADFEAGWRAYLQSLSPADLALARETLQPWLADVRLAFERLEPILQAQDRRLLNLFVGNDLEALVNPFLNALVATTALGQLEAEAVVDLAESSAAFYTSVAVSVFVLGLVLALALGIAISRSIAAPVGRIAATVDEIAAGNYTARTGVAGKDELGTLGQAFDRMLEERVTNLSRAEAENEALNDAVIELLQAVSQLSQRDLRVRVPVTEGVTGPVADALNLLTSETAGVLEGVRALSYDVAAAAQDVKRQSDRVLELAEQEREEVSQTSNRLTDAARRMAQIAKLARSSAQAADQAISSTQTAMVTVTDTVAGIGRIRDTIREAEKRIKRLGDRSQEISGVVNLINSIAERTHILALNASMHAASAGEAGRGFAVVADEVQRLAENARDATGQISTLVNNIQIETADTVTTMNDVISQVVAGSKLAEEAGEQMRLTRSSTENLVGMVQRIASGSTQQARTSIELSHRAEVIRKGTEETSSELIAQSTHTYTLVELSGKLLSAVDLFKLPISAPPVSSDGSTPAAAEPTAHKAAG